MTAKFKYLKEKKEKTAKRLFKPFPISAIEFDAENPYLTGIFRKEGTRKIIAFDLIERKVPSDKYKTIMMEYKDFQYFQNILKEPFIEDVYFINTFTDNQFKIWSIKELGNQVPERRILPSSTYGKGKMTEKDVILIHIDKAIISGRIGRVKNFPND